MEETPKKEEKPLGKVTHFFNKIGVAVVELQKDSLKVGETLHFKGGERDFEQKVDSMQIEHESVPEAKKGESIGLKVEQAVREGDQVFKVLE
jgi:translation elongation factor EF-1alpha